MHLIALSYYQLKIEAETLEENGTLKALLKRLKNKSVTAMEKEGNILFTSGNKIFTVRIAQPNADRKNIDQMIPKIPKGISSVELLNNGILITF